MGLAMACRSVAYDRDLAAGEAMAKDAPRLAVACEASAGEQQQGGLLQGCRLYEDALASALEQALVEDDAAYPIFCPEDGIAIPSDRASFVEPACARARELRDDKLVDAMLADPDALEGRCAAISEADERTLLATACLRRADIRKQAERERIANDERAFSKRCSRFGQNLSETANYSGHEQESDELEYCWSLQAIRDRGRQKAGLEADLAGSIFASTSSLSVEARARVRALIAKAKSEGSYPKRPRGDRN
jgi:hypothetical protein